MRLKMTYTAKGERDAEGNIDPVIERFEYDDFDLLTPIISSSGDYPSEFTISLNNEADKFYFTSYRGYVPVTLELVEFEGLAQMGPEDGVAPTTEDDDDPVDQIITNPPPITLGTIPAQTAGVSSSELTLNVTGYFRDATDALTFTASSSNTSVVAVSVTGEILTMTPGATVGNSTITVTATDSATQRVTQTFTFTTTAAVNAPPTTVGTITARTATVSGTAQTLDISTFFSDTDALTYAVASSNTNVVTVSISGSTLTMTPQATVGSATITVAATDTASQSVNQTFQYTTTATALVLSAGNKYRINTNAHVGRRSWLVR